MRTPFLLSLFSLACFTFPIAAAPPSTKPIEGLRENTPTVHAFTHAKIVAAPGSIIERGTLVVRDGAIVALGPDADVKPPADAKVWDLAGKVVYPGLIDAFSEHSVPEAEGNRGAAHWNSRVTPQVNATDQFQPHAETNKSLRSQGITTRLVAPAAGIIKGTSSLVTTGDEPGPTAVLHRDVALHLKLTIPFRANAGPFPDSPMGAVALARQTFLDADWHRRAWQAHRASPQVPRPERNDALEALQSYLGGERLVIADAANELFALRADQFAREFSLRLVIRGSGKEYRRLDAIRDTGRVLIVPVNFPVPPDVTAPEDALNVSLERLLHWDFAPENPGRLDRAGVRIALTTAGLKDVKSFLNAVRQAVGRGLSPDAALRALTVTPAELFHVQDQIGTLAAGKRANFLIADGDLFAEKTAVVETWVNGQRYEVVHETPLDARGRWDAAVVGDPPMGLPAKFALVIGGKSADLNGSVKLTNAGGDVELKLERATLHDRRLAATFPGEKLQRAGVVRLSLVFSADNGLLSGLGQLTWPDGATTNITVTRSATEAPPEKDDKKPASEKKPVAASNPVQYPFGPFGRLLPPEAARLTLFKNATLWTCGGAGIIAKGSLLIGDGKILAVGPDLAAPADAVIVDLQGKHISPGIIDCHSHMATDGGINERSQAVTAEVRIGDFIDANDLTIYRQLGGGVTCANILHGSANPIGGQNQVIKLRWGLLPEQLKFTAAPAGIKFALGENVKQSNWGERYRSRYPQTRMGVEQLFRDTFEAARDYQRRLDRWERLHEGLPPRRDLELDALAEVLAGRRWIHCHSYRQDEILAFLRVLEEYGVRVGTLQHILEGYKVADALAKHGAMGSSFSDWWAYKFEVFDAIPYNGALMHKQGVVVSFNSDDKQLARHLNQEAAKAVRYGGVSPEEALKFVTLNPAKQLRIDGLVGSLEPGKQADFAVWSGSPLSNFSRCEQTWIDGRRYYDRTEDRQMQAAIAEVRNALIQKILASGEKMQSLLDEEPEEAWPTEDTICHGHDHDEP